ncbi:hypothetical protein BH20ACI4_BH20ACI4_12320 [soil metagenome]
MKKILLLSILLFSVNGFAQIKSESEKTEQSVLSKVVSGSVSDCTMIDFHYLILENSKWTEKVRHIEVFLDENAFSEENLKVLFHYLSKKNSAPRHLTIFVFTNWKQLPPSSDCPPTARSNMPENPNEYDYHKAVFYRRDRKENAEYFEYNSVLKTSDLKRVYLIEN